MSKPRTSKEERTARMTYYGRFAAFALPAVVLDCIKTLDILANSEKAPEEIVAELKDRYRRISTGES